MDSKRIEEISAMSKAELVKRIASEEKARHLVRVYTRHAMITWNRDELINMLIDFESESDRERQTER